MKYAFSRLDLNSHFDRLFISRDLILAVIMATGLHCVLSRSTGAEFMYRYVCKTCNPLIMYLSNQLEHRIVSPSEYHKLNRVLSHLIILSLHAILVGRVVLCLEQPTSETVEYHWFTLGAMGGILTRIYP